MQSWKGTHLYLGDGTFCIPISHRRKVRFRKGVTCLSLIQLLCRVWLFVPHGLQDARLPYPHQLSELTQIHVRWVSDAIQQSHLLLSPPPHAFNHSQHQGLSNESVLCIRWPKYWGFTFSISPSNEYSGLISFRMDCLDLLAVQGPLKSLLQHHHCSKASILSHLLKNFPVCCDPHSQRIWHSQ